jgi:hypothetical protein
MQKKIMRQMTSSYPKLAATVALAMLAASAGFLASGEPIPEGDLPQPRLVIMDKSIPADQAQKSVHAARLFYAFWNTGDPQFAKLALATDFTDRTLPKGRPQGIDGPLFASRNFRQAVPDLRCDVEQLIVAGDRVGRTSPFLGPFQWHFWTKARSGSNC